MRIAISPRLATRTLENTGAAAARAKIVETAVGFARGATPWGEGRLGAFGSFDASEQDGEDRRRFFLRRGGRDHAGRSGGGYMPIAWKPASTKWMSPVIAAASGDAR